MTDEEDRREATLAFCRERGIRPGCRFEDEDDGPSIVAGIGEKLLCHPVGEPDTQSSWVMKPEDFAERYLKPAEEVPMREYPRLEVGTRVALACLTDDEEDLNGLVGEVVELLHMDIGPPPNSPMTGERIRGWVHKIRLDDADHPAQAGGFMDERVFLPVPVAGAAVKLWAGKLDRLRKKAKRTGFLREFFYPEPSGDFTQPTRADTVNLDHLRDGMEAGERLRALNPDKIPPHTKIKGWAIDMGYEPGDPGTWHMILLALPYRRPTYAKDWELVGDMLDYLGVTPEAVDETLGGSPWPFAAHFFHWPEGAKRRTDGSMRKTIPGLMGWSANWEERLDWLRNDALAKESPPPSELIGLAQNYAKKQGTPFIVGNPDAEVSPEIAAAAGGVVAKTQTMGWEFCLMRILDEEDPQWSLSAMLYPHGRASKQADWEFLGNALAHLGAPEPMTPTAEGGSLVVMPEDANRPAHWHWRET